MKRILGLDLGAASIGWALIEENKNKILGLGSRIIPYEGTEGKDFSKGTGESRNSIRTKARTTRKGYDRYQLRRKFLIDTLIKDDMMPDETLSNLSKMQLWELRSRAVSEEISKKELGRLLLLLNQKRGYKSGRSDANADKKDTDLVSEIKSRYETIKELNLTIGQFFYNQLKEDEYYRIKDNIFPREAYIAEFDTICNRQKKHLHLPEELIHKIRNEIIYYQRPLKSQKGLVSVCEFEGFRTQRNNKEYFVGPKVAPKSSPLFQMAKIWESINNLKIESNKGESYSLSLEQKKALFYHLDNNEKLTTNDLFKILGINKKEYTVGKQLEKGIQGNITKAAIKKCFNGNTAYNNYLQFNVNVINTDKITYCYGRKNGEIKGEKSVKYVDPCVEKEPLYQLWHVIYSINDSKECISTLIRKFQIDEETAEKLAQIDFTRFEFGNKSAKSMRKILPYLMEGDIYSNAMSYAGYNHSNSQTKEERFNQKLEDKLRPVEKNL